MDMPTAFSVPVVHLVNDKEVTFPRLSPPEVAEFVATLQARDKAKAKKLADESGIKGRERLDYLEAFESEYTINAIWTHAMSAKGAIEVASLSLKKAGKTESEITEILGNLYSQDVQDVAHEVTGYKHFLDKLRAEKEKTKPSESAA